MSKKTYIISLPLLLLTIGLLGHPDVTGIAAAELGSLS